MVNVQRKEELLRVFMGAVEENVKANLSNMNMEDYCKDGDADLVKSAVEKIRANVVSAIPTGYAIPKASMYVSCSTTDGKNISLISISLTNGWKDAKKFKFAIQIPVSTNAETVIKDFFYSAYEQLFVDMLAEENIAVVNALMAECAEKAGLSYKIVVVSSLGNEGKKVSYIADDEVDFVADPVRIFNLDDILALQEEPDELVTEEMIEKAKQPIIDELGLSQTTVQLVGNHGGAIIKYVSNIGTQVRAMTIIKKVNNKNAKRLTGAKDTVAYYEEDGVYAVVARRDGKFEVLLKPFDEKSLANVDVDVLAKLA